MALLADAVPVNTAIPLSLYIHIPWCVQKCPYCDFNSHAAGPQLPEHAYGEALQRDLLSELQTLADHGRSPQPLHSIFIGGGTPSLFSARTIASLLEFAEQQLGFEPGIEITLEANPGTAEQQRFKDYRAAGVNRLSIGVQSFDQGELRKLGRIHNKDEALQAAAMARAAGFDNFNLDLMHGLPNQSVAMAMADLEQALALEPTHLSWYQLTIEPNTAFYSNPPLLPQDDTLADIQEHGHAQLCQAGLEQYEVSAYCREGRQSRHNRNYWQFGDYLGIGAGAHGKLTTPQGVLRRSKTRQPTAYLERNDDFVAGEHRVTAEELPLEFMMNALRLIEGVPAELFSQRTALPLATVAETLEQLRQRGLLVTDKARLAPTPTGLRFLNHVLESF